MGKIDDILRESEEPEQLAATPVEGLELSDDERQPCEIWTRVMGYHRPVSAYNPGKQQEHSDRKPFKEAYQKEAG